MKEKLKVGGRTRRSARDAALTREEFEKVWEVVREGDEYDRLTFVCAAQLGMRAGEIAALRKSWVDFQRQAIRIPYKDEGWQAKTKAAARVIPFGRMRRAPRILQEFFDYHDEFGHDRFFIWHRVLSWGKKAGLTRPIFPHALRATAAFQFAEAGLSAQALRQIMGWSDLRTAQSYIDAAGRAGELEINEKAEKLW
jgi:integrase